MNLKTFLNKGWAAYIDGMERPLFTNLKRELELGAMEESNRMDASAAKEKLKKIDEKYRLVGEKPLLLSDMMQMAA